MPKQLYPIVGLVVVMTAVAPSASAGQSQPAKVTAKTPTKQSSTVVKAPPRPAEEALERLRSGDWLTRMKALELATADPTWRFKPIVRQALVSRLELENAFIRSLVDQGRSPSRELGEEYTHYFYSTLLLNAVTSIAFTEGPRAMAALADAAYDGESPLARQIAAFGAPVVDSLLALSRSHRAGDRQKAVGVMGEWLLLANAGRIEPGKRRPQMEAALLMLARDRDMWVRVAAAPALSKWGTNQAISELEFMASGDQGTRKRPSGLEVFPVREAARIALHKVRAK